MSIVADACCADSNLQDTVLKSVVFFKKRKEGRAHVRVRLHRLVPEVEHGRDGVDDVDSEAIHGFANSGG
jgi:hypothetical protein